MANTVLSSYAALFSNWQASVTGPKPSADLLEKVHGLGLRAGLQALAVAMSLRDSGVTGKQIVIACGAPQLNRMRGLIAEGLLKRVPTSANAEGHMVYKNTVTPKGDAEIKRQAKIAANANASTAKPEPVTKAAKVSRKANAKVTAAKPEPAKVEASTKATPASAAAVAAALAGQVQG